MRLPALTAAQADREDARAFHEALWRAYADQRPVIVPLAGGTAMSVMHELSSNIKNFWRRRGYRLRQRVTADRTGIAVSLVAIAVSVPEPGVPPCTDRHAHE